MQERLATGSPVGPGHTAHAWMWRLWGAAGHALQSGGVTSWALPPSLVKWGLRLCFPTRWCHWLESMFRWGYRQVFVIAQGLKLGFMIVWAVGRTLLLGGIMGWILLPGRASKYTLQLSVAGGYALWLGIATVQAPLSGETVGCALRWDELTGWASWLGSTTGWSLRPVRAAVHILWSYRAICHGQ